MGQERPLISVIVPVYNVGDYLHDCLASILAQSYRDIEVILVDDASTDGSDRLCDTYAARDQRVQAVHLSANSGPSAARNEGIRRARGEYIVFVDADDTVEPRLIETLYTNLAETGADISICGADGIQLQSGPARVYTRAEAVGRLAKGAPFNHVPWGKLYKARLVKRCPFDEKVFYSEDLLFLYGLLKQAGQVSYLPEALCHYTQREGSQVQSGVTERKCTAFAAQDAVCADAAVHFPETEADFRQLALEANRCLAVLAVKKGAENGQTAFYLKRIQENTRRHLSWQTLRLCPRKRDKIQLLALCAHTRLFRILVAVAQLRRSGGNR